MQKDFHYLVVRLLCEKAGFSAEEAQIISYASQYVDDAVEHKRIKINNMPNIQFDRIEGDFFDPICSAHKGLQYLTGLSKKVQRDIYIPFHFIPPEEHNGNGKFKYITSPNSPLANQLITEAVKELTEQDNNRTQKLIKLGIALHSFADTWAHQRFSGRHSSRDNDIERIKLKIDNKWEKLNWLKNIRSNMIPNIGHGEAFTFPDQTHLNWKYEHDSSGIEISRDNSSIFLEAAYHIYLILIQLTQTSNKWKDLAKSLKLCLSTETDSYREKKNIFKIRFPDISFNYDEDQWRNEALTGECFDWIDFDEHDYEEFEYEFKGDLKWFYFHIEASQQRKYFQGKIKENLK